MLPPHLSHIVVVIIPLNKQRINGNRIKIVSNFDIYTKIMHICIKIESKAYREITFFDCFCSSLTVCKHFMHTEKHNGNASN